MLKKILVPALVLVIGGASGAGAAFGTAALLGIPTGQPAEAKPELDLETALVSTGPILVPLVNAEGRLSSYVTFDAQVEVEADKAEAAETRLPVLLNAINMRAHRTPMASGPDGLLPGVDAFRKLLIQSAEEAFGKGVVKRAMITRAAPV